MAHDTGSDWALIGETQPWFGVLSSEKYLKANLTQRAVEEFYEQGRNEIAETVPVDFGCRVSRQTPALRDHAIFREADWLSYDDRSDVDLAGLSIRSTLQSRRPA